MVIHCAKRCSEDRHLQGRVRARVADLVGLSEMTVQNVLADHNKRVADAVAKGQTEDAVVVPNDTGETRARRFDAAVCKTRHLNYVQGVIPHDLF